MVKTRSRPVISKIFVMLRSLHTSESCPSFVRSRLTPPTSTPSVVESMNVVFEKSTITSFAPLEITSRSCCLNSGAVYRSTSPESAITYEPLPTCSVAMSKFIGRSRRSLSLALRNERLKLRKRLLGLLRAGAVRLELQVALVRVDRHLDVARVPGEPAGLDRLDRHTRKLELRVRLLRRPAGGSGDALVPVLRLREGARQLEVRVARGGLELLAHGVGRERLAERRVRLEAGRGEVALGERGLRCRPGGLGGLPLSAGDPREGGQDVEVLPPDPRRALEGRDRLRGLVVLLVEGRERDVRLDVVRVRADLLLLVLDPRAGGAPVAPAEEATKAVADPRRARTDAEGDEADREDEREQDVDQLRV